MKKAKEYLESKKCMEVIYAEIKNVINKHNEDADTKGYLNFDDDKNENSLDVTIGSEKFTIRAYFLKNRVIEFSVFAWVFDLKSPTMYSDSKLNKYTFVRKGNQLTFKDKHPVVNDDGKVTDTRDHIFDFTSTDQEKLSGAEFLLEQLERYVDERGNVSDL